VQRFDPILPPPGEARPDWWILTELGRRVTLRRPPAAPDARFAAWRYRDPAQVMDELAALAPIYGGISHGRLGPNGLQWPCTTLDHPGTPILHVDRPARGGAAWFVPVSDRPPAEVPDAEYPLLLTTGRVLEHYHGGTMTRRVPGLHWLVPETIVELHPADAGRRGIVDGQPVRLRSRRGTITARARVTAGIVKGTVFAPFHFAEAAANLLTHAALDPVAKIPEYKVCAVAIEPADAHPDTGSAGLSAP
jgi:predicted molibdopterin-dependent oxidoreductase YjgC